MIKSHWHVSSVTGPPRSAWNSLCRTQQGRNERTISLTQASTGGRHLPYDCHSYPSPCGGTPASPQPLGTAPRARLTRIPHVRPVSRRPPLRPKLVAKLDPYATRPLPYPSCMTCTSVGFNKPRQERYMTQSFCVCVCVCVCMCVCMYVCIYVCMYELLIGRGCSFLWISFL